jgi:hypothetical protein
MRELAKKICQYNGQKGTEKQISLPGYRNWGKLCKF